MMLRKVTLCLLFCLLATAYAQMDAYPQALWEMYEERAEFRLETSGLDEWKTLETARVVMASSFGEGDGRFKTVTTTSIDYPNKRVLSVSEDVSENPYRFLMLYDGGTLSAFDTFGGETEQVNLSEDVGEEAYSDMLEKFDTMLSLAADPEAASELFGEAALPQYDGYQRYGDVLAGEQFTLDLSETPFLSAMPIGSTVSLLLTPDSLVAGMVTEFEGGRLLNVYDPPTVLIGQLGDVKYEMFSLEGKTASKVGDVQMRVTFNVPLDDEVFELPVANETR